MADSDAPDVRHSRGGAATVPTECPATRGLSGQRFDQRAVLDRAADRASHREAVREADVGVTGPHWYASADHEAQLDVYRLGAENARRRAEAIAAGLGVRLGPVVAAESVTTPRQGWTVPRARAGSAMLEQQPNIPVDTGQLTVSASVRVVFAIEAAPAPVQQDQP